MAIGAILKPFCACLQNFTTLAHGNGPGPRESRASIQTRRNAMNGLRILIVDDETEAGDILCLRLKRRGALPFYVPGGREALDWLKENRADIMLLDVKMPNMDGLELLEIVKKEYPLLPVIILSGHADMESAARGMALGAFFYLLKPVDLSDLSNKIEDALSIR